jgi:hypothetical protein
MRLVAPSLVAFVVLGAEAALAQAPGPTDPNAPAQAPAQGAPAAPAAPAQPPTIVTNNGLGGILIGPRMPDPNSYLPSSSQPRNGDATDTFDLGQSTGGPTVVGNPNGSAVLSEGGGGGIRGMIPPIHLVRHGDTLWDLSDTYYGNPWQWPRIWSMNPQVTNPHWIYPGDQLRMLPGDGSMYDRLGAGGPGNGNGNGNGAGGQGLINERQRLSRDTVVLRDQGYIGDVNTDTWGQVAGSPEEQMFLTEGNHVFVLLKPEKVARPGEELTVFRSVRPADKVEGSRKTSGEVVKVLGTVKIRSVDPKTHVASAIITESLDIVERGAKVGPVRRKFSVVPPLKSDKAIVVHVLNSFYPHVYVGQNQVVFLDHGSQDGLKAGNRLVVLRRGDTWRRTLNAKMSNIRLQLDTPDDVSFEDTPLPGNDNEFPEEAVAELRILTTEPFTSLAFIVQSQRELVPGDVATTRPGF